MLPLITMDVLYLGTIAHRGAFFGAGSGPIFLERFGCNDESARLLDCALPNVGVHGCDHSSDAGVTCIGMGVMMAHSTFIYHIYLCYII